MKKSIALAIILVLIQISCFSQLAVTTNSGATALAQNITGNGVTVTNATINCNAAASGTFNYSGSNLGLTNGIILSTGQASDAVYSGTSATVGTDFSSTYTDPNLTNISPLATNDVCLVAFDFVPICNSLSITFVFASNEYPTYVNSVNDAFGIFLSGANPGGGSYSGTNIATLPNGTAVSINNVNNVTPTNPQYYHDNYASPNNQIAYNGYTIPITSVTSVSPCTTYHMEIAIADASDGIYDSSVFIQGNSISCTNTPSVTTSVTAANCGNTGSATATVTSYTGPITYQWLPGNQATASITNIAAGTYTCLVGLQSGCGNTTQTVTAVVPSTGSNFNFTTNLQNPSCNNGSNGIADIIVSGGTAPYTYTWTTSPVQNSSIANNLPAGTYTLNMTDNAGCAGTKTVTLVNPPSIVATVTTSPTTCSSAIGIATASVTSGGTSPYTYVWSNTQQTQTINGLTSGLYSVVITDVNTCTATASGTVGGQGFTWTLAATSSNPKCFNSTDGTATVTITNPGTNTFTYSWNTAPVQTNSVATALSASGYVATVTDNNGCSSTASVTLVNPSVITATVNTTPTICSGSVGSATASVLSGGLAPFNYTWLTTPAQAGSTASNLAQGTYSVVITDANGCPLIDTGTVHSTGFTWIPIATSSPTKCFNSTDGTATVNITNPGSSIFNSYLWMPSSQTSSTANNLAPGNYSVTVTDNIGCASTATVAVTKPSQLVASTQSTPALCTSPNGTAHVNISGGTQPYQSYSWSVTSPLQTSQTATGLTQGQYTVLVTDANNCTITTTATILDTTDLTVTASQSPDLCSKGVGKATANPTGQSPYTFIWSTTPAQSTQTADSLRVGTYSVNVIDANGCTASAATTVVNQNDILVSQFITTPEGEIYAENPVALTIAANSGWSVTSAYVSDSSLTTNIPITSNPFSYVFPKYGDYSATYYYTSVNGCKDSVTEIIIVKDFITLYIPNTFTPNGDGLNETFAADGTFVNKFEMYIYDRWGILVAKLDNINKVWDGSKNGGIAPEDTYVYKGSASDIFGKQISFHGQVNLIR